MVSNFFFAFNENFNGEMKWPDFEYHVGKLLKYNQSGYNSSHPSLASWGPPWTLETLGDHWRPLATLGDMPENGQFPPKTWI